MYSFCVRQTSVCRVPLPPLVASGEGLDKLLDTSLSRVKELRQRTYIIIGSSKAEAFLLTPLSPFKRKSV